MARGPTLQYYQPAIDVTYKPEAADDHVTYKPEEADDHVTYKAEEADALGARPAAAEEADRGQESSRPDEEDGEAVERDDRVGRVVTQQVSVEQRILRDVKPYSERGDRPTNHLQVGGATQLYRDQSNHTEKLLSKNKTCV